MTIFTRFIDEEEESTDIFKNGTTKTVIVETKVSLFINNLRPQQYNKQSK